MEFKPISATAYDQDPHSSLTEHARLLTHALLGLKPSREQVTEHEITRCPELARHVVIYVDVLSTAFLLEINALHPEEFGIHADGISLSGSAAAWKRFLLSPWARASENVRRYLTSSVIARLPSFFVPNPAERRSYEISGVEKKIAEHLVNVYGNPDEWRAHLHDRDETRVKCLHRTVLVEADAFTLYPLSRLLSAAGVATLAPTDLGGFAPGVPEYVVGKPEMPPLSEPWFEHEPGRATHSAFEEAEAWYRDIRETQTATVAAACMPAMTQTRLLVTATEKRWNDVATYDFIPWSSATERMIPFYRPVIRACAEEIFHVSKDRAERPRGT